MRYCLYQKKTGCTTYLECKKDLHNWIKSHRYVLSDLEVSSIDLHRVLVGRSIRGSRMYILGSCICSLREYIVKHKLL